MVDFLPNLTSLDLGGATWILDIEGIAQLPFLEKLYLPLIANASAQVEVFLNAATAETSKCRLTLKTLFIDKAQKLSGEVLAKVAEFPNLEQLSTECMGCVDEYFIWLLMQQCSKLKQLQFAACWKLGDTCLGLIAENCPNLVYLDVTACVAITVQGISDFIRTLWNLPTRQRTTRFRMFWRGASFQAQWLPEPPPAGCHFFVDLMCFRAPECHTIMQYQTYLLRDRAEVMDISSENESTRSTDTENQSDDEVLFSDSDFPGLTSGSSDEE